MSFPPYRRVISSVQQRWYIQNPSSCFAWPSNEVTPSSFQTDELGDVVLNQKKLNDWKERIARGQNATTRFVATSNRLDYTEGHIFLGKWCANTQRWGFLQKDGDLFSGSSSAWSRPPSASTTIDPKTDGEALINAIKDARSKQSHFRGGTFLAELRDTLRGLRNPAKGIRELLDSYHKSARRNARRAAGRRTLPTTQEDFRRLERDAPKTARDVQRALSDTWLESNFGWAPLISDTVDSYQALRRLATRVPLVRFFGQSSNDSAPTYTNIAVFYDASQLRANVRTLTTHEVRYYGAVKCNVDSPPSGQAIEEFGVRARDFIPAVWEAIPYSFLIDYFSNIGDVIEVCSFPESDLAWAARTYRNHSIRSTERVAVEVSTSPAYPGNNSNKLFSFTPPSVKWDRTYVDRDVVTGFTSINRIRFEMPGSKNWKKWLNIAALARLRSL